MNRLYAPKFGAVLFGILSSVFLLSSAASAVPVNLVVAMNSNEGGFGFSYLHNGDATCILIGGVDYCQSGNPLRDLTGTLTGDLTGNSLSGISGTIMVAGEADIIVTGGFVDFDASAPDTYGGQLVTATHGTFYFLDRIFAGAANGFDGTSLRLWGNNWNNVGTPDPGPGITRYGIDLGITVVPEPGTALLLGLGLAVLGVRRSD